MKTVERSNEMIGFRENPETNELLLKSIEEMETSIINYFRLSEKLIEASLLKGIEKDAEYDYKMFKLSACLHAFFHHVIELQKILLKKRTAIIYYIPHAYSKLNNQNFSENQHLMKVHLERTIDLIFSNYPFLKNMYLLTEQLEEFLHYYKKNNQMFFYIFDEENYPEPSPPLLKINTMTKKVKQRNEREFNIFR